MSRRDAPGFPRPMEEWTVGDVQDFLEICRPKLGSKVYDYQRIVAENDVDGEVLLDITDEEMSRLGIKSLGHRMYITKMLRLYFPSNKTNNDAAATSSVESNSSSASALRTTYVQQNAQQADVVEERFVFTPATMSQSTSNYQNAAGVQNFPRAAHTRLQNSTPRIHESLITISHKIGSGSVATVYAGMYEQQQVAIKKHNFEGNGIDGKAFSEFELEVGKMTAVNHPCIVRCFGMLEPTPGIVLELVECGSLFEIIHKHKDEMYASYNNRFNWKDRIRYLLDALYGLRAIHNAGMIHGDFKTLNLLVSREGRLKVADFGLSKVLDVFSVIPGTKTITGTPQYMAPEVMQSKPQGLRVDLYSVGVVMWEVLTGTIPWKDMDVVQIIQKVTHHANEVQRPPPGRPPIEQMHRMNAPCGYIQLLEDCWAHNPNLRPSADMVVVQLEAIQRNMVMEVLPGDRRSATGSGAAMGHYPLSKGMQGFQDYSTRMQHYGGAIGPDEDQYGNKRQRIGEMSFDNHTAPVGMDPHRWYSQEHTIRQDEPIRPRGALNPPAIFLAAGGLNVLIDIIRDGDDNSKNQAATALFESCANNPENQVSLARVGGMDCLSDLLKRSDRPDLQIKAAFCIAAACSSNTSNRISALNLGIVAPLVAMLNSPHPPMQEGAAQALANIVKRKAEIEGVAPEPQDIKWNNQILHEAQEELNRSGGIEHLVRLAQKGIARVKAAAAAAIANAMADNPDNREAFQEAGGIAPMLKMLKDGDLHAQENATTALWNAMVDNKAATRDLRKYEGLPLLIAQLHTGTPIGQELAAGAIWKACANDDLEKTEVRAAIPGLVNLLRNGNPVAQEQAAGALRSACVNSPQNKLELNRVNGIGALVEAIRFGTLPVKEQAGAALANACANCVENQSAARHAGAIQILVDQIRSKMSPELMECCIVAVRNLCVNSREHQEELHRCNGVTPLLELLQADAKPQLLEYVAGALAKSCTLCEDNKATIRVQFGIEPLKWLLEDEKVTKESKRLIQHILLLLGEQ